MNDRIITRELRRHMERAAAKYPAVLTPVPQEQWPDISGMTKKPYAVLRSREFLVQCFAEHDGITRLSVARTSIGKNGHWIDGITWDELQTIKRQVGLGTYYAIEIYPKDKDVVNVANMRHLWVLREPLNIGWIKGE